MLEVAYLSSGIKTYPPLSLHDKNEVWDCTTCSTCSYRCPREAKPMDVVVALRSFLLENGNVPRNLVEILEGIFKHGNPWSISRSRRSEWAKELNVKYASEVKNAGLLYFVGCTPSYDLRSQGVAKAIVDNLNKLKIDFSILGNEESCCGNEVYSIGEMGLFEELKEYNLTIFDKYHVEQIITTSPHCYNAFKNRYGTKLQAIHYTQYFAELLDSGKLKPSKKLRKTVTYHDPCFLGKHNDVYEEPRKLIENIQGVRFIEMSRSRKRSLCCEGGGGRMWYDIPGRRLSEKRIEEALDMGAEIIATACPFCLLTLEDSVKTMGNEDKIQVKDVAELVAEAL